MSSAADTSKREALWRKFEKDIACARSGFADLTTEEIQAFIDEAVTAVRAEMWPSKPASH